MFPLLVLNTTVRYIYIKIFTTTTIRRLKVSKSLLVVELTCGCIMLSGALHPLRCSRSMNLSQTLYKAIVDRELIITESYYDIFVAEIDITYQLYNVYHLLIIFLWFSHWVKDYQPVLGNFNDHEYPVKAVYTHIYIYSQSYNVK